ncbi:MAG: hypothetical protein L3J86_03155, partial [Thermoplasmata archaeon]|nr:hypothetical protein [Thermoplasmata archaeon]
RSVVKTCVYFVALASVRPVRLEAIFDEARWVGVDTARSLVEFDADRQVVDLVDAWLAHR